MSADNGTGAGQSTPTDMEDVVSAVRLTAPRTTPVTYRYIDGDFVVITAASSTSSYRTGRDPSLQQPETGKPTRPVKDVTVSKTG